MPTRDLMSWGAFPQALMSAPGGLDPVSAARDVFRAPDFWWKRLEQAPTVETSFLQSIARMILGVIGRILKALFDLIAWFLGLFSFRSGGGSGGATIVWLLAGLLLAWSIWKLAPRVLDWLGREAGPAPEVGPAPLSLPAAASLREDAFRALREGRHADAVRLALLTMIARLEKRELLRYDATRTNREYRQELRPRPELADRFGRLARIYEGVWYGRETADRDQAEESIRLCDESIDAEASIPG